MLGINWHWAGCCSIQYGITKIMESDCNIDEMEHPFIKYASFWQRIEKMENVAVKVFGLGTGCAFPLPNPILTKLNYDHRNVDEGNENMLTVLITLGIKDEIMNSEQGWKESHQLIILFTYYHCNDDGVILNKNQFYPSSTDSIQHTTIEGIIWTANESPMHWILMSYCPTHNRYYDPHSSCCGTRTNRNSIPMFDFTDMDKTI